jgi:ribose 5-phosphate isomerase B
MRLSLLLDWFRDHSGGEKVPGIRETLCAEAETDKGARLWNYANVLCLSPRTTAVVVAQEILEAWFSTGYQSNDVDDAYLAQATAIERSYWK